MDDKVQALADVGPGTCSVLSGPGQFGVSGNEIRWARRRQAVAETDAGWLGRQERDRSKQEEYAEMMQE